MGFCLLSGVLLLLLFASFFFSTWDRIGLWQDIYYHVMLHLCNIEQELKLGIVNVR